VIEITAVRFAGGRDHEQITEVEWRSASTVAGLATREGLAQWLGASESNRAFVRSRSGLVDIAVVTGPEGALYIRSHTQGKWRDDLLALPTF
jgi:hypothetical protein